MSFLLLLVEKGYLSIFLFAEKLLSQALVFSKPFKRYSQMDNSQPVTNTPTTTKPKLVRSSFKVATSPKTSPAGPTGWPKAEGLQRTDQQGHQHRKGREGHVVPEFSQGVDEAQP